MQSKKSMILDVASKYFSHDGYDSTSLESIAVECGITKPAIYYHFKDKSRLYETILLEKLSDLAILIEESTQGSDPIINLQNYINVFGNYIIDRPSFSGIFAREIANGATSMPQSCIVELSKTLDILSSILADGEQRGIFECENPFMIQMMVVTTLTSYVTTKPLRERVAKVSHIEEKRIDPELKDLIGNLSKKIIKALRC